MNKTVKYLILILLLFALLTMPVTVPVFKSSTPYSMFNRGWDGTSKFAKLAYLQGKNVIPVFESFDIANISNKNGVLLIIGPNVTFTDAEINQIKTFLDRGNTLLIADDFGSANEILQGLKLPVAISKYPLHDFFYEKDDRLIVAVRISNPILGRNVTKVVTNEPSAIIISKSGEVYVSKVAMINLHRRMYPLMTEVKYGNGRVVVLSDPDILTNMQFNENKQFLKDLIDYLGGDTFYFDEAHHPGFNLYTVGTVTVTRLLPRERALRIILVVSIIVLLKEVGIFGLLGNLIRGLGSRLVGRKESPKELALILARENGWEESEVMEMLRRIGD